MLHLGTSRHAPEVVVVGSGKRVYLWVEAEEGTRIHVGAAGCVVVSGPRTLAKIAKAILCEVEPEALRTQHTKGGE